MDNVIAARELLAAIQAFTGRSPRWIVNSHKHSDHWGGNQVFAPGGIILATRETYRGITAWGQALEEMKKHPEEEENRLHEIQEKLNTEGDPIQRDAHGRSLGEAWRASVTCWRVCRTSISLHPV